MPELEARRGELYARLVELGDFRRGSVSENYRRCGKPNCVCARGGHRGHCPRLLWTRRGADGKTVGRQLSADEVGKVRRELAAYDAFAQLNEEIMVVNEAICEARPVPLAAQAASGGKDSHAGSDGEKGGFSAGSRRRSQPK